jgi:hypothetical protein
MRAAVMPNGFRLELDSAGQKAPEDAFWGSRYAIVEDPDGNAIGLMSPADLARQTERPPPPQV